jgi:hypothetical protein
LLIQLGLEHEKAYLKNLRDQGLGIVEIPTEMSRLDAVSATIDALHQGVDVVYQAVFQDGDSYGHADFLKRVDRASSLGNWSYEAIETKLARSTKIRAVIQLCHYSELLSRIQTTEPEWMHVVLGSGTPPEKFLLKHYLAYFRKIKREFLGASATPQPTYPNPNEHCRVCDWSVRCNEQWRTDDSLTLVANISRNQRKALGERDVSTLAGLAGAAVVEAVRLSSSDGGSARHRLARGQGTEGREGGAVDCGNRNSAACSVPAERGKLVMKSTATAAEYLRERLRGPADEQFRVLYLNRRNALLEDALIAQDSVDSVRPSLRNMVARALQVNASALIAAHNGL